MLGASIMKKTITYIIFLLIVSWTIGFLLSTFYPTNVRLEWGHLYMWTPAIFTLFWFLFNRESFKGFKWALKRPWWFYIISIYLPLIYVIPEAFTQELLNSISYNFSTLSIFKELAIKLPFVAIIGLGIPVLGEELAWRGYLQDKLVSKMGPINGVMTLGIVWAIWHLPEIMQKDDWVFTAFIFYPLFCISLSFIIYWAMTKCNSIWIAVFIHAANNYIWGTVYNSATIHNTLAARITSLIFFVIVISFFFVYFKNQQHKMPAPNRT